MPGPLDGVKVVACSIAQAGTVPYSLMADLGAEVIKVEVPGTGDGSRRTAETSEWPSSYFETNNRGVKSVTLNLKSSKGREILHRLVSRLMYLDRIFVRVLQKRMDLGMRNSRSTIQSSCTYRYRATVLKDRMRVCRLLTPWRRESVELRKCSRVRVIEQPLELLR